MKIAAAVMFLVIGFCLYADDPRLAEIDQLYATASKARENSDPAYHLIRFWDEEAGDLSNWSEVGLADQDSPAVFEIRLYVKNGRVYMVTLFETSPSGDWTRYSEYCFRNDGTTACVYAQFSTFFGNVIVERVYYLDVQGKEIKTTKTVKDLETAEPMEDQPGTYMEQPPIVPASYRELKKLLELPGLDILSSEKTGTITTKK
ncbi:MAG TPA: hypothetical protein ENN69_02295 [Spirochaetia bacterium]|nr:hypothetical protein [Spirochaetia bacterium]